MSPFLNMMNLLTLVGWSTHPARCPRNHEARFMPNGKKFALNRLGRRLGDILMVSDTERVESTFHRKRIGKNNLPFLLAGLLLLAILVIAVLIKASGPSALYPVHAN